MNRKNFVSICFSTKKIQVLWMSEKKDSVISFKSYDLPEGSIVNHKIENFAQIITLLKQIWKEMKIPTKYVGIVLPEFATYTKLLTLPKLDENELNEAVMWQAQEFLPNSGSNMITDWKIVQEVHNHYNILVYSIHYDVLAGFVDVVGRAGLFPIVVETPSLSLMRLAKIDNAANLLIYVSYDETILIITFEGSILATSVARSSSQQEILQTAIRMLSHYGIEISRVQIAGAQIYQNFIELIKQRLGVSVEYLEKQVKNIGSDDLQRYLLAISLQEKNTDAPRSSRTVNLLPPNWEDHYKKKARDIELWTLSLTASLVIWASFIGLALVFVALGIRENTFEKQINNIDNADTTIYQQIEQVNNFSNNALEIVNNNVLPQEIINQIYEAKLDGIEIKNYSVNFLDGSIKISGIANSRDNLVNFKNNLLNNENFENVNIPIDVLLKDFNINFEISFTYSLLKQSKKEAPKLNI